MLDEGGADHGFQDFTDGKDLSTQWRKDTARRGRNQKKTTTDFTDFTDGKESKQEKTEKTETEKFCQNAQLSDIALAKTQGRKRLFVPLREVF